MLVSFYGKSSLKLVFTEACSQWDDICCHFVLIFKEDLFIFMLHGMCWVFCLHVLLCTACVQCPWRSGKGIRTSRTQVGVGTEPRSSSRAASALKHWVISPACFGFLRWGLTIWPIPCWPGTVPCQPPKGWDGRHALSWVVLVLVF